MPKSYMGHVEWLRGTLHDRSLHFKVNLYLKVLTFQGKSLLDKSLYFKVNSGLLI